MVRVSFGELMESFHTPFGVLIFFVFMNSLSGSIWMNNAWSPLIYQIFGNSNIYVGLMSALNGMTQMLFAFVGGHLADKIIGPSRTLILSVNLGIFSLLFNTFAVWMSNLVLLILAQILYGTYMGLSVTSVESVFAQCVNQGERDHIYGVKFAFESSGPIGGLVISLVLFALFGNSWRLDVLRWVITAGILLHVVSMKIFLLFFKPLPCHLDSSPDGDSIVEEAGQSELSLRYTHEEGRSPCVEEEIMQSEKEDKEEEEQEKVMTPVPLSTSNDEKENGDARLCSVSRSECFNVEEVSRNKNKKRIFFRIPLEKYPYVVALADIIVTLGSGMTTQYFPLFMMNVYYVSPVGLSSLGLVIALLISLLAIVNSHLGSKHGRARILVFPKLVGSFILLYMALARGTSAANKWLMCIAYVARMAIMNSTTGLSRALIMDFVSERRRGIWSAVESVQSASWSGTALLGGYLADHLGYGSAFIATFAFHITACMILLPCTLQNDTIQRPQQSEKEDDGVVHHKPEEACATKTVQNGPVFLPADDIIVHNITLEEGEEAKEEVTLEVAKG